jgi:hypothetical protein
MAWKSFQLPAVPSGVTTAVDGLSTILSTTGTALELVKGLATVLSSVTVTSLSASQIAINAAVASVNAAVKSLTEDAGVYVLLVPPRSKVIIPEGVKAALAPSLFVTPTPAGLNTQAMFAEETTTVQENAILRGLFSSTGGNAGFVRMVTESFDDLGDANRPQLADTDAVAGMYIVAGATNIASLFPFTNGMSSLLAPGKPTALDPPATPAPQNLKVKAVNEKAAHLTWDFQAQLTEIPALGTFVWITEVAVIRSTSIMMLSASTPLGLFGSSGLSEGTATTDGKTKVVLVVPHTGEAFKSQALDATTHDDGAGYYYAISYRVKMGTAQELSAGGGTDLGFLRLSNVVKVYYPKNPHGTPRSITGVPPDWYRTSRAIDLFPAVGELLNQVAGVASQLGDASTGYGDRLKANIKILEQQIQNYADLAAKLTATSSSIAAFSSINLGTASFRAFSGTGGVNFIKKDLVKAFGDTSDPSRPPFDSDEFVSGVVILATTPSAAALLSQVMEGVNSGVSLVAAALEQIDVELANIETAAAPASSSAALTTLVGEQAGYCYQSYAANTEFDESMNPI